MVGDGGRRAHDGAVTRSIDAVSRPVHAASRPPKAVPRASSALCCRGEVRAERRVRLTTHDGETMAAAQRPFDTSVEERDDPRVLWPMIALFWAVNVAVTTAQVYVLVRERGINPRL